MEIRRSNSHEAFKIRENKYEESYIPKRIIGQFRANWSEFELRFGSS